MNIWAGLFHIVNAFVPDTVKTSYIVATLFSWYVVATTISALPAIENVVIPIAEQAMKFYLYDSVYTIWFLPSYYYWFAIHHICSMYIGWFILNGTFSNLREVGTWFFFIEVSNMFLAFKKQKLLIAATYVPCRTFILWYTTYKLIQATPPNRYDLISLYIALVIMSGYYSFKIIRRCITI